MGDNRNTIAFIKKMLDLGYTQKQIGMITKEHQSKIQRVAAKKTYQYVSPDEYVENGFFEMNKKTLDTILSYKEIPGHGELSEEDIHYIRLIKFCGGDYHPVRWIYRDRSNREIRQVWNSSLAFEPQEFDAKKIGLKNRHIYFLLV